MASTKAEDLVGGRAPPVAREKGGARRGWRVWAGSIVGALPVVAMVMSSAMKLARQPQVIELFVGKFGYPESTLGALAVVELSCAVLYAIPRTAVLGAILMTGYLGGAVATHVRVGEVFAIPLLLGILAWVGLYLRDPRLHALVPLRRAA